MDAFKILNYQRLANVEVFILQYTDLFMVTVSHLSKLTDPIVSITKLPNDFLDLRLTETQSNCKVEILTKEQTLKFIMVNYTDTLGQYLHLI
jgi:hypothetical protein